VLAIVQRLAQAPGTALVATAQRPTLLDPTLIDDGTVEVMWIGAPRFHDRVALLTHELRHAVLTDTTVEDLAASLVGATRAQVVARCHAALHSAALRSRTGRPQQIELVCADFR
jgi:SpoVK/Ycf46/Vps4 family AAA+-type ATPase